MRVLIEDRNGLRTSKQKRRVFYRRNKRSRCGYLWRVIHTIGQHDIKASRAVSFIRQQIIACQVTGPINRISHTQTIVVDGEDVANFRILVSKNCRGRQDDLSTYLIVCELVIDSLYQQDLCHSIAQNSPQRELILINGSVINANPLIKQTNAELPEGLNLIDPDFINVGISIQNRLVFRISKLSLWLGKVDSVNRSTIEEYAAPLARWRFHIRIIASQLSVQVELRSDDRRTLVNASIKIHWLLNSQNGISITQ